VEIFKTWKLEKLTNFFLKMLAIIRVGLLVGLLADLPADLLADLPAGREYHHHLQVVP
jgi:hypothetical protein